MQRLQKLQFQRKRLSEDATASESGGNVETRAPIAQSTTTPGAAVAEKLSGVDEEGEARATPSATVARRPSTLVGETPRRLATAGDEAALSPPRRLSASISGPSSGAEPQPRPRTSIIPAANRSRDAASDETIATAAAAASPPIEEKVAKQ